MDQNMIGWAAGLFEGEGCISLSLSSRPKGYPRPRLSVTSTDLDVLEKLLSVVGFGYIDGPKQVRTNKPFWTWRCAAADEVATVLTAFLPYLGKRRSAKVALAFEAIKNLPGRPLGARHWKAKITAEDVAVIRSSDKPQKVLAGMFGISQSQVSDIKLRNSWKHAA
jgi:hypothetical protein